MRCIKRIGHTRKLFVKSVLAYSYECLGALEIRFDSFFSMTPGLCKICSLEKARR
jgi:hypothetical protein